VTGGASRVSFDDQSYKAVAGEASWKTTDFEQAADRYEIDFARGVRDLLVDTLALEVARVSQRLLATVLPKALARHRFLQRDRLWDPVVLVTRERL
jgi:hypothetical protein